MTEPYLGEIQIFGFNFAPAGWALCNGATMQVRQFSALFSLVGTTYGGNGTTTFQLPNFAARAACSQGTGPGLTQRTQGETFGTVSETLTIAEMPGHTHALTASPGPAANRKATPAAGYGLSVARAADTLIASGANTTFAPNAVGTYGNSQPHANQQPFLALNFCISLAGNFPAFN